MRLREKNKSNLTIRKLIELELWIYGYITFK